MLSGDSSQLTIVSLQDWDDEAVHLGQHDVVVGRDASVRHIAVTIGGGIVRLNTNASYSGPGGSFEAFGVYFADAGQHLEHRLFVDHEAPHCTSNVEYKGALQGETAHTVWVGDVLIRAAAEGTETYELNRNLVLTDGARATRSPTWRSRPARSSARSRLDDRSLRRPAAVLPAVARCARGRGPSSRRARLLQHHRPADRRREISERVMRAIDIELEGGRA